MAGLCQQPLFPRASSKYAETGGRLFEPEDVKSLQSTQQTSRVAKNERCVLKEHLEVETGQDLRIHWLFSCSCCTPQSDFTENLCMNHERVSKVPEHAFPDPLPPSFCAQSTWPPLGSLDSSLLLPCPLQLKHLSPLPFWRAKVSPCQLLPVERDVGGRQGG